MPPEEHWIKKDQHKARQQRGSKIPSQVGVAPQARCGLSNGFDPTKKAGPPINQQPN